MMRDCGGASHRSRHAENTSEEGRVTNPFLCAADEADSDKGGAPPLELAHPVAESGLGGDDQVGAGHVPHQHHVA